MADSPTTGQKIAAEVIGTFTLVFFGCGTAIIEQGRLRRHRARVRAAVLCGAYAFGRVSGAHFNPAVSVGAALGGRMAWREMPLYVGSQLVGGLLAGLTLFILVHGFDGYDVSSDGLAQNGFGDDGTGYAVWAAFLLEMILTAVFVWVILAVTDARNEHPALAPAAIGLALTMVHLASISATGTSVNPARSIGVGLFAGSDAIIQLWLFILAPLVGAAIAGITYPMLFGHGSDPVPGSGLRRGPAARCRATALRTSSSRSGTSRAPVPPAPMARSRPGADHPGRLAVGPRGAGVEAAGAVPAAAHRPARTRRRAALGLTTGQGPDVSSLEPGGPSTLKVRTRPTPPS